MIRSRANRNTTTGKGKKKDAVGNFSTASLLPNLLPWLRELFAERNLVPIRDEAWDALPAWDPIVAPDILIAAPITLAKPEPIPADTRASTAPIPFRIPVDAREPSAVSPHVLRILRPLPVVPRAPSPNFLTLVRGAAAPVRAQAQALRPWMTNTIAASTARARTPAPTLHIPAPYDELLAVGCTVGPLMVLWCQLGWPVWSFLRLPHPAKLRDAVRRARADHRARMPTPQALLAFATARTPNTRPLRHTAAFALALAAIILPVKLLGIPTELHAARGRVLGATATALTTFEAGGAAAARSSFTEAIAAFDAARSELDALPASAGPLGSLGIALGRHLPVIGARITREDNLRQAARTLATASSTATRGLALLHGTDVRKPDAADRIAAATAAFTSARTIAEGTRASIADMDTALLPTFDAATGALRRASAFLPIARALAGIDRPRRILLVFQNPAELRPTGGFIGSIALLDVQNGRITALELPKGGSYDVSGITRMRVLPPEPLRILGDTWQFHDANWFPDFPTSAQKLRWFYAASGGPSVDAVVAVNATILTSLLDLTGPITVGDQTFTASDALAVLTNTVEDPAARATGAPKAVLGQLAPAILDRLLVLTQSGGNRATEVELLDRMLTALDAHDVLIHFTDDAVQQVIVSAGWSGELRPVDRDALMVVHTNIGGGKSDARMREDIAHTATVLEDGSVVDTVTITRTHDGTSNAGDRPSEQLANFVNRDYLRVYVPRGSTLLAVHGLTAAPATHDPVPTDAIPDRDLLATELHEQLDATTGVRATEEFGRTAFGGWVETKPGHRQVVRFTYRLPWTFAATTAGILGRARTADPQPYSLSIQKQPGTHATIRHTIELTPHWRASWLATNLRKTGPRTWSLEDLLTSDRFTGMMVSPN